MRRLALTRALRPTSARFIESCAITRMLFAAQLVVGEVHTRQIAFPRQARDPNRRALTPAPGSTSPVRGCSARAPRR
jgi:hypothetical protein